MAQCAKSQGLGDRVPIFKNAPFLFPRWARLSLRRALPAPDASMVCCRPAATVVFPFACPSSAADIRLPFALVAQRFSKRSVLEEFLPYGRDISGCCILRKRCFQVASRFRGLPLESSRELAVTQTRQSSAKSAWALVSTVAFAFLLHSPVGIGPFVPDWFPAPAYATAFRATCCCLACSARILSCTLCCGL